MILSTLYTQKYSIIQILCSAVLVVVLYVNYLQNKQIKLLNKKIEELSTNSTEIIQRLAEKELDILINKISTTQVDTLLIAENNENIKLYLLIAGGGGCIMCYRFLYLYK